jgi:hypothetical protein
VKKHHNQPLVTMEYLLFSIPQKLGGKLSRLLMSAINNLTNSLKILKTQ